MKTLLCLLASLFPLLAIAQEDVFTVSKWCGGIALFPKVDTLTCSNTYSFSIEGISSDSIQRMECLNCKVIYEGNVVRLTVDSTGFVGRDILNFDSYKEIPSSTAPICIFRLYKTGGAKPALTQTFRVICDKPWQRFMPNVPRANWLGYFLEGKIIADGDSISKAVMLRNGGFSAFQENDKRKKIPWVVNVFRLEVIGTNGARTRKFYSSGNKFSSQAISYLRTLNAGQAFRIYFTNVKKKSKIGWSDTVTNDMLILQLAN